MKDEEIEVLFEDEEDIELAKKRKEALEDTDSDTDFIKDPSLDNVFPDKDDINMDRLLNEFEKSNDDLEELKPVNIEEIKEEKKSKKMKLWQKILVILICLALVLGAGLAFLLYGPYPNFRNLR